jgi:cytochrome c-type biogenesis protein CcmE
LEKSSQTPLDLLQPPAEGATILAHRGKALLALAVLVAALGYFGFMAFQGAAVYYYTVGEVKELGPTEDGGLVRVSGKLAPASFYRPEGSTQAHFTLMDEDSSALEAVHEGVLPDLFFNEHSEIILEGAYTEAGVFESQNVIVKCPSKYIAADQTG